jgi:hypothetical protein
MGEQADTGDVAASVSPIQVDVNSLADFQALLGRELSANLQPGSDRIQNDHNMGVRFGARNAGGRVQAARKAYYSTLMASTSNLLQYVRTAEIFIEAIQAVVAGYSGADQSAAGTSNRLRTALGAVFKEHADAAAAYPDSETRRELHRAQTTAANPG